MKLSLLIPRLLWMAVVIVSLILGQFGCQQIPVIQDSEGDSFGFDRVKPILEERCLPCHQGDYLGSPLPDFRSREDLLDAKRPVPLVLPGKPEESRLLQVIYLEEETDASMPPLGHGLDLEQKNAIGEWIRQGAIWPEGEVLQSAAVADIERE